MRNLDIKVLRSFILHLGYSVSTCFTWCMVREMTNKRMIAPAYGQLGRLTARFFNVLVSLHLRSALQRAPYAERYASGELE